MINVLGTKLTDLNLDKDEYLACAEGYGRILPVIQFSPKDAFNLYQTTGFPVEMFLEEIENSVTKLVPQSSEVKILSYKQVLKIQNKL